jgi:aromatic-L-amino-acid decarboxylase
MAADVAAGFTPAFVCATVGTTSSTAVDPVAAIAAVARRFGAWLHVDAAMAGSAMICPEFRALQAGVEQADSYCFDPHKWLFTNFDCSCLFVRERGALIRALSVLPEYLRNRASESGAVIDYRDWHVPLGRRFRALKLWFVLRHYGAEGLRHHLREHVRLARWFADQVAVHPDFELAAPVPFNLVCFRHRGGDAGSEALLERLNGSGRLYLTHTRLDGRFTLRLCVGQTHTEARHVEAAWAAIRAAAEGIAAPAG